MNNEWPETLRLRDTGLHDDMGGLGQRIFTTAGAGYKKVEYVRADLYRDMAKRLEAADRKVSRLTAMRNEWERDAREHLMTFGQHLPASVECLVERFDSAIAAAQEGEG